jgi:hypothetical protein
MNVFIGSASPTEVELKFENRANSQLKFTPIENSGVMVRKLQALCSILGIMSGSVKEEHIADEYFDDA